MANREDFEITAGGTSFRLNIWRPTCETRIGESPALLAVDLYNLVYKGGAKPPHEFCSEFPSTCGQHAHAPIEPTLELFARVRGAGLPVFYCAGIHSTKQVQSTQRSHTAFTERDYDIHEAFTPEAEDHLFRKERASAFSEPR